MNEDINQTQFSQESPLFTPEAQLPSDEVQQVTLIPWFKKPLFIFGVLGGVLFILILGLLLLRPRSNPNQVFVPANTPLPNAPVSPQQAKINELRSELEMADPATQELPFPAVNMELSIPDDRELR